MKIFFSYGHDKHSEFVKRLACEIEKRSKGSIQVWIDSNKITQGCHWRDEITKEIKKSDSVIAFLSSYSSREESVCRDELSIALVSKHGIIRTILLEKPGESFMPPSRVSEYQWGDLSDYPKIKVQGEEAFSAYIEKEADKIIAFVNSDEVKQYAEEVRSLRSCFNMPPDRDTWTKFDNLIEKELIGREWLFKLVKKWEEDDKGKRVLLICGKPGAGKSMFSAHLQMRDPAVVAAFPCDCRHSEYKTTQSIIMQIAYRLALRLPDYRRVVINLLKDSKYNLDSDTLFEDLILQPLSTLNIDGNRAVMVIVVDALDEAENDSLADFISRYADSLKKYVRFLVTSREVPAIVERFKKFSRIDIDAEKGATNADLAAYYESKLGEKLEGNPDKEAFIQQLIKNSEGVFTYAECVTENILDDIEQGKFAVKDYPLPDGIDALFRDTLDRSFHRQGAAYTENDYADKWRTPLGMILASPEPMPISTLRSLMNWKNTDLKDFRRPLFSLLTETEGTLTLFHRSFGEWLETTDTSYAVSKEDGISDLAEACFSMYTDCPDDMDEYMLLYTTKFLRESSDREHKKYYRKISEDQGYTNRLIGKAENLQNKNAFARALDFYSELLLIDRELKERYPENPDYLHHYSASLGRVAGIYEARNELARALEYYKKEQAIFAEIKEQYPENPNYLRNYSISLLNIARIYEARYELRSAFEYSKEALEIDWELKERYPEESGYLRDYYLSLEMIAGLCEKYKKLDMVLKVLDKALKFYEEALVTIRELRERYPENPVYLQDYSISLNKVAGIYQDQNKLARALKYYEEALAIRKELIERYPEDPNYLFDYSVSLNDIACLYWAQNKLDIALKYHEKALAINRELKERYPENLAYLKICSISLHNIALIYEKRKELDHALKYCEEALTIRRGLKERYPESLGYLNDYSVSLFTVACIYEKRKELDSALKYCEEGLAISRELKERYPDNLDYFKNYANSLGGILRLKFLSFIRNAIKKFWPFAKK